MTKTSAILLATLLLAVSVPCAPQDHLGGIRAGMPFPDHAGFDAMHPGGDLVSPSGLLAGKGATSVFLSFFQTTCGACLVEIDQLKARQDALRAHGVEVLLVGVKEEPADLRRLAVRRGWPFPVLADRFDGPYSHRCGVFDAKEDLLLPSAVLLAKGRDGTMVLKAAWQGGEPDIVARILDAAK
jgi:peroxiredoxin